MCRSFPDFLLSASDSLFRFLEHQFLFAFNSVDQNLLERVNWQDISSRPKCSPSWPQHLDI